MRVSFARRLLMVIWFPGALRPSKPASTSYSTLPSRGGGLLHSVRLLCADIEKCCLLCSMFTQLSHLVHAAGNSFLLFSLIPALCFVPLSLLPCVFLLALCKCRTASWHTYPPECLCLSPTGIGSLIGRRLPFEKATSAVRAAAADDRDSRRAPGRLHRQNDDLRPSDVPT